MAKMPGNVTQDLDAGELAELPSFCKYVGDDPALAHLRGLAIPTRDVQRLVYVGERENIWVDDGEKAWRPWMGVDITERDDAGNVVVRNLAPEPLPKPAKNPMNRAQLAAVGFTDATLGDAAQELLGETWDPPGPGDGDARRAMYERVLAAMYGQAPPDHGAKLRR